MSLKAVDVTIAVFVDLIITPIISQLGDPDVLVNVRNSSVYTLLYNLLGMYINDDQGIHSFLFKRGKLGSDQSN
jgi:hypothetical protein